MERIYHARRLVERKEKGVQGLQKTLLRMMEDNINCTRTEDSLFIQEELEDSYMLWQIYLDKLADMKDLFQEVASQVREFMDS